MTFRPVPDKQSHIRTPRAPDFLQSQFDAVGTRRAYPVTCG
jgi:hypothetical protein